jgi:4-amino-4-deoxy-L-arabinose transferase-like glycosyltransferase
MTSSALTKNKWLGVVVIMSLLLSGFIIFYRFCFVPQFLTFDEIEFAKLALSLDGHAYIPYSPLATGHATLYFYILLQSLKLFGITSFGLRLPSAIFGMFAIILFYLVIQKSLNKMERFRSVPFQHILAIGGLFLFATTRWFFNFARFGFEGTFLITLELVSLLFFLHYLDHKEKKWLIGSGIFAGLAYNSYQPGRLFFLVILIALFVFILERKNNRLDFSFFSKKTIVTFLTFLMPFIICITPLTLYLSKQPDIRVNQLLYPTNTELSASEKFSFFGRNIVSTVLLFSVRGDVNGRHNYPNKAALNPIISIFFVLGLFFVLKDIKNKINQIFLLYFCISIFPTLLTYPWENPNMLRTISSLPSIVYFSIYSFGVLYRYIHDHYKIKNQILVVALFFILSASALYDLRTYYIYQAPVFFEAFEAHMPLQYYIDHPEAKVKK